MMKMKHWIAASLLSLVAGIAMAGNDKLNGHEVDHDNNGGQGQGQGSGQSNNVPEIDGALSIQMLALLGGVIYLIKRKK